METFGPYDFHGTAVRCADGVELGVYESVYTFDPNATKCGGRTKFFNHFDEQFNYDVESWYNWDPTITA